MVLNEPSAVAQEMLQTTQSGDSMGLDNSLESMVLTKEQFE